MKIFYENVGFAFLMRRKIIRPMKLIALFTLAAIFQLRAEVHSQSFNFNETNTTVKQMFKQIEKNSNYSIFYRLDQVNLDQKINVITPDGTIENVMSQVLINQSLTFAVVDEVIVVKLSNSLNTDLRAIVKGTVKDVNGETLPGVSVKIKGTNIGTTTEKDGNYTLNVTESNPVLVFTYIGFVTQEIPLNGRTSVNVVLNIANTALNEVVVTALGISREAKSLTYSAQKVSGEDLTKATGTAVINGLQGKVAGLTITRSGSGGVGAGSTVLLRGNRSITGSNAPLYITDGVPGGIGMEDGDNIESITVLKGAAAAALYGSSGQNGVILITTKKGKAGATSVQFNGGLLFDKADVISEFQNEYGQGDAGVYNPSSERSFGPKMAGQNVTLWNGSTVPFTGQKGRFNDFFRTGTTLNNSLSVSGGGEKMQTLLSYGNIKAQGILDNNDLTRHNLTLRISNTISKKLSLDTKLTYNNERIDNIPQQYTGVSLYLTPVSIPLSEMQKFAYTDAFGNPRQSYWKPGSSIQGNPYFYMNKTLAGSTINRLVGLVSAKYDFNSWISLQVRGNVNQNFSRNDNKIYSDSYFSLVGSNYSMGQSSSSGSNVDALLTFKHDLTKDFKLSGHFGGYVAGSTSIGTTNNANGLFKQDFFYMSNAKAPQVTNTYSQSPSIQSLYSSLTLAFKDYLYLDVTGRNDWSSALPKADQSVFYPSVGLTAIISDMIDLPSWVSYGKARVSSANSGFGGNAYLGQEYYLVSSGGGIITPTIKSPGNYKPELTTSFEAGLDWRFFGNRLGFDVTYYKTKTTNQLLLIGVPTATLFDQKYINAGLIENNGIEVVLSATPIKAGKFSWDAMLNYSKNNNKVVRITDQMTSVIIQDDGMATKMVETGKSFGTMYVKGWQRDAQGRKLVDNQGRPLLTSSKNVYAGNTNPDFMAGMTNSFNYTNISLGFLIDYRNGGTIISGRQPLIDAAGHSERSLYGREGGIILDAYLSDGTKNTKSITSQQYFSAIGDRYPTGEEYSYSGTNIRLREVTLNYKIPAKLLNKNNYIKNASISLVGRNLFFFQKSTPFDPDISSGRGGTEGAYDAMPFTRTYGLNLQVGF